MGLVAQQCMRLHDHAGDTKSTLRCAFLKKCLLDRVQNRNIFTGLNVKSIRCEALDRDDFFVDSPGGRQQAGLGRLAVHHNDATATLTIVTGFLGTGQIKVFPKNLQKCSILRRIGHSVAVYDHAEFIGFGVIHVVTSLFTTTSKSKQVLIKYLLT